MKIRLLVLASCIALAGCGDRLSGPIATPGSTPATASKVDQLERRYLALRPVAELLLPYLPPLTAARIELLLDGIDKAIAIARVTSSTSGARASADDAAKAIDELQRFTGPPPT